MEAMRHMVEEADASPEVARIYNDIKTTLKIDFVPNFFKAQAHSLPMLRATWELEKDVFINGKHIDFDLKNMIFTAISAARDCDYCTAAHMAFCVTMGVDKDLRKALITDLGKIKPPYVHDVVCFATKCAMRPHELTQKDFDKLAEHGLHQDAFYEIVAMASLATYANVVADSLQIAVDEEFRKMLAGEG